MILVNNKNEESKEFPEKRKSLRNLAVIFSNERSEDISAKNN